MTDSSSIFNDDMLAALDDITILCILSSSVSTRVKSVLMTDVVEVSLD